MDHNQHARRLHQRATKAHGKWVAGLTPAQRRKLKDLGVLDPPEDHPEVDGHNPCNVAYIAESSRAQVSWDPAEEIEGVRPVDVLTRILDTVEVPR